MSSLKQIVDQNVREAAPELVEKLDDNRVRCYSCGHELSDPRWAARRLQSSFQSWRKLYVPWGYVGGVQCDPIEKKPFFHAWPGASPTALECWAATFIARIARTGLRRRHCAIPMRSLRR